jgi:hypothetical protein
VLQPRVRVQVTTANADFVGPPEGGLGIAPEALASMPSGMFCVKRMRELSPAHMRFQSPCV